MRGHDVRRLSVEAVCHDRTVRRWIDDPGSCTETTRIRLELAAERLGLTEQIATVRSRRHAAA